MRRGVGVVPAVAAVERSASSQWRSVYCLSARGIWRRNTNVSASMRWWNVCRCKHTFKHQTRLQGESVSYFSSVAEIPAVLIKFAVPKRARSRRISFLIGQETSHTIALFFILLYISDLFLRIGGVEYRLTVSGKKHVILTSLSLVLSLYLSSSSVTSHSIVHSPNIVTLSSVLLPFILLLSLFLFFAPFLLSWHPWTYSFHWRFVLAWEGYHARLIVSLLLYSALSKTSCLSFRCL